MSDQPNPRSYLETFAALIRDSRISHGAFRLWHALRDYTNAASQCFPGQRRLADDIACHPTSLKPWTEELIKAGWLKVEGGNGRRFDYTVLDGNGQPHRKVASAENKTAPENRNAADAKNRNAAAPESRNEPHRKVETKVSSPIKSVHLSQGESSTPLDKTKGFENLKGWQLRKDLRETTDPAERAAIKAEIQRRKGSTIKSAPPKPESKPDDKKPITDEQRAEMAEQTRALRESIRWRP